MTQEHTERAVELLRQFKDWHDAPHTTTSDTEFATCAGAIDDFLDEIDRDAAQEADPFRKIHSQERQRNMAYYLFHTRTSFGAVPSSPQFTGPFKSPTAAMEYGLYHFLDRWTLVLIDDRFMFGKGSNSISVPVNAPVSASKE